VHFLVYKSLAVSLRRAMYYCTIVAFLKHKLTKMQIPLYGVDLLYSVKLLLASLTSYIILVVYSCTESDLY